MNFPKGPLISWAGTSLSDHNRSTAKFDFEPVKADFRVLSGKMRRIYIVNKRKLAVSWNLLPALDSQTVDGLTGRNSIRTLYDSNIDNTFTVTYKEVNISSVQTTVSFTAFVEDYNEELVRRADYQLWNISLSFVEQ